MEYTVDTPTQADAPYPRAQVASRIQSAREQELRKRSELARAKQELRSALVEGRDAGLTLEALGELVGLSRQRVHEMLNE